MSTTDYLPKDQEEINEFLRLRGQEALLDELDEMYESEEFETFYQSPASKLLSPWYDKKRKDVTERLNELAELIRQKYEV